MYCGVNLKIKSQRYVVVLHGLQTWDDRFAGKVGGGGGWEILRNGGEPSNGGMILKWGEGG